MKLSELLLNQVAIVDSINNEELSVKLFEMGLLPGEEVAIENFGLLGNPIAIRVGDYKMCMRVSDAGAVEVKLKA